MTLEKLLNEHEDLAVEFRVSGQLLHVDVEERAEDCVDQLTEGIIVVVFTHSKVDIVAEDEAARDVRCPLQVLEALLVRICLNRLARRREVVVAGEEVRQVRGDLFEHDKTVDRPGVEAESIRTVVSKLQHKLEGE